MLHIDRLYADRIAPYVRNFDRRSTDLWNFSCPICNDSATDKNKARGYIYKRDQGLNYMCHNCGASMGLGNFLRHVSSPLHQEYVTERFKEGASGHTNYSFSGGDDLPALASRRQHVSFNSLLSLCTRLDLLPDDHFCRDYVRGRHIPDWCHSVLYYTHHLGTISKSCAKDYKLQDGDGKLILPFFTEEGALFGMQARSLDPNTEKRYRYMTLMFDETVDKVFGLERIDFTKPTYIVEGPIDSLFLPNCLAMAGADAPEKYAAKSINIFDNEPRSVDICRRIRKLINKGFRVVIWPRDLHLKDINDMVLADLDVVHMIQDHTYQGPMAQLKFNEWRKCDV